MGERQLAQLVEKRTAELADANANLQRLTVIDALTEISNRRHFDETLGTEWRRAYRADAPLSLIMIDVDHF